MRRSFFRGQGSKGEGLYDGRGWREPAVGDVFCRRRFSWMSGLARSRPARAKLTLGGHLTDGPLVLPLAVMAAANSISFAARAG
jgi:hypothetical protein